MIRHNLVYKLLALAIALIVWVYVGEINNPKVSQKLNNLQLDVRRVEDGYTVTGQPKSVTVLIEGTSEHIKAIQGDPDRLVKPYVNMHGRRVGRHRVPIGVEIASGYAVTINAYAIPTEAVVTLEKKAEQQMKVAAEFAGSPPVGYQFGPSEFSPSRVKVSGIPSLIKRVARIVAVVQPGDSDITGIDDDYTLIARDETGREIGGVEIVPAKVRLRMGLEKAPARRAVFVSPNILGRPPFGYTVSEIDVEPQTVALTGRPEVIMHISTLSTEPLRIAGRTRTMTSRLRVLAPPGTSLPDGSNINVTVRIVANAPETPKEPATPVPHAP